MNKLQTTYHYPRDKDGIDTVLRRVVRLNLPFIKDRLGMFKGKYNKAREDNQGIIVTFGTNDFILGFDIWESLHHVQDFLDIFNQDTGIEPQTLHHPSHPVYGHNYRISDWDKFEAAMRNPTQEHLGELDEPWKYNRG